MNELARSQDTTMYKKQFLFHILEFQNNLKEIKKIIHSQHKKIKLRNLAEQMQSFLLKSVKHAGKLKKV